MKMVFGENGLQGTAAAKRTHLHPFTLCMAYDSLTLDDDAGEQELLHTYQEVNKHVVEGLKKKLKWRFVNGGIELYSDHTDRTFKVPLSVDGLATKFVCELIYNGQSSAIDRDETIRGIRSLGFDSQTGYTVKEDARREDLKRSRLEADVAHKQAKLRGPEVSNASAVFRSGYLLQNMF